jgi:hypothetical protein
MSDGTTPRERFKEAAEAAVRRHQRNVVDRGLSGADSALHVGLSRHDPGLLDVLADLAEQAYGDAPAPRSRGQRAV